MHDDLIDSLRYCAFIGGRGCGKTEFAKQLSRHLLNSSYGLASSDNWAQRYLYVTDKLYDTLGIKDYLNKVYGDPTLKFKNGNYIRWDTDIVDLINQIKKEEEKNNMANCKEVYRFETKDFKGDRYEITIEKSFGNNDYPYHVRLYGANEIGASSFIRTFGYRFWEQLETQFMYDLASNGVVVCTDCRDEITCELGRAKIGFGGRGSSYSISYANCKSTTNESKAKSPFEAMPKIEKVIFNPPATIVKWKDGTKTVVKCQDDDEFDWEKGLAMAYVKRAFNNERTYYGLFKKNEPWMNLPNSNVKYDPNEVKKLELFVSKDVIITEKGIHDAVDALTKACDDKIDEMLGDVDISRETEFVETGKWPEK